MTPEDKSIRTGAVVSDLHLFTNRTTVHEHMPVIRRAADECDLFVFNGDIFDFHWSLHDGFLASVAAAEAWIRKLIDAHPDTRFVFLLGNHDSVPEYIDTLTRLADEYPRFEWREQWYRADHRIFLHGDVYHMGADVAGLKAYRDRCNRKLRRSRILHAFYWAFASSGLMPVLLRFARKITCARRIHAYLQDQLGPDLGGVREVYFGHVHTPYTDFRHGGLLFHNTGSATRGARLSVMRFQLCLPNQWHASSDAPQHDQTELMR